MIYHIFTYNYTRLALVEFAELEIKLYQQSNKFLGAAYLYAGTSTFRVVCVSVCVSPILKHDQ